ncbi:MAG: nitroreductase family protein [bacterium]
MINQDVTSKGERLLLRMPEPGSPFNAVEDVIYRRRSVRFYDRNKQVPEYIVRRIIEAGRFAPSAGNSQPWKFIVVRDQKMIREMEEDVIKRLKLVMKFAWYYDSKAIYKAWIAKVLMRFLPNMFHPVPFGAMKLIVDGKLGLWHGAPTVIIILTDKRSPGDPSLDVGIAGENMVLTATSYGLGTCWVSFMTPLAMYSKWRKRLGIRYPYKLVTSIAIGYPRGSPYGYVTRETKAIDWFCQDGSFKVVY